MRRARRVRRARRASWIVTAATVVLVAVVGTAAASAAGRIPHPRGADAVVLRVESSPNGWGAEYPDGSKVTVHGDGRVVIHPAIIDVIHELRINERGIQRVLSAARAAGLLRATDYGEAGITDQGTTSIEVRAAGEDRRVSVYALLLEDGDRGLTDEQRAARRALRTFVHDVSDPDFYDRFTTQA